MQDFIDNFANLDSLLQIYPLLLQGLWLTVLLSLVALPLSLEAGLVITLVYSLGARRLNCGLLWLVDVFRAFPVIVLLILVFYGLPFLGIRLSNFGAATLALVLNNAAYFAEIFRGGFDSVPATQHEAARALGLRHLQLVGLVILPQALRRVLPPLASNSLELVKETSIASMVALPELLRSARVAQEQTYNPTPLVAAAAVYVLLLWPCARIVARLERQMLARA